MEETENSTEIVPAAIIAPAAGTPELSAAARAAVSAGMPAETKRAYERNWRDFTAWCQDNDRTALPASTETLTEYVTWLCYSVPARDRRGHIIPGKTGLSPSSVRLARWAIIKAHELAEVAPPYEKRSLLVIKGYETALAETRDPRAKRRKATPATPEVLREFTTRGLEGINNVLAARDRAMFLLNYSAATRVSELVALDITDVRETAEGLLVSVYRRKTRSHEEVAIPAAHAPETVRALTIWIAVLKEHGREDGPLFPRVSKSGVIGPVYYSGSGPAGMPSGSPDGRLSVHAAPARIKAAADAAGLEGRWTMHSGRRGFATQARFAGHDKLTIARHGGWSDNSAALDGYMADADKWMNNPLRGAGI